jgi:hypothetical protein
MFPWSLIVAVSFTVNIYCPLSVQTSIIDAVYEITIVDGASFPGRRTPIGCSRDERSFTRASFSYQIWAGLLICFFLVSEQTSQSFLFVTLDYRVGIFPLVLFWTQLPVRKEFYLL